jgi:hypothetical protein
MQASEIVLDAIPVSHGGQTVFICHPQQVAGLWQPRWFMSALYCFIIVVAVIISLYLRFHHVSPRMRPAGADVLATFHHDILRIDIRVSHDSALYVRSMEDATRKGDRMALFDAANGYGAELDKLEKQLNARANLHLGNVDATRWAGVAHALVKNHIAKLKLAGGLVIEGANLGEFRPDALSAVENALRTSILEEGKVAAAFRRSYGALGIPPSQIDFVHGGFN